MKLTLYKTKDNRNVVGKALTNPKAFMIHLKKGVNISTPRITLRIDESVQGFNYAVIDTLKRTYFIERINNLSANLWELELMVDVLETYGDDIRNANCEFWREVRDGDFVNVSMLENLKTNITRFESANELEPSDSIILTTIGEV